MRDRRTRSLLLGVALVKASTVALLLFAATHGDWDRFAGKAMEGRAIAYPLALAVLPAVWFALVRRRGGAYPALADLLVSLPFAIDVVGNALDAYDRISWFDDACHFLNWALLLGGLAVSLSPALPAAAQIGLVVGLGSTSALGWELAEYVAFIRHGTELGTAYTDTLGDMTLGTLGAAAAGLAVLVARRRDAGWTTASGSRPATDGQAVRRSSTSTTRSRKSSTASSS